MIGPLRFAVIVALFALIAGRPAALPRSASISPARPGVTQPVYTNCCGLSQGEAWFYSQAVVAFVAQVRNNFLLRVAPQFVAQGMTVAVIDTPSDRPSGMGAQWRATAEHVTDIAGRGCHAEEPVACTGLVDRHQSRGSISAANVA